MVAIDALKPLIHWFYDNPTWGGIITCLISLLESLAIIGYLIPGSLIMPAIGALIGAGILPFYETMAWAILGAALGDGLSYWLGRRYHQEIRSMWPFTRYPNLIDKAQVFFEKHGAKSVFIGRFVGPVRPMVPLIAGMLNMPRLKFFAANIGSGILWAPSYLAPGILIGVASLELPPEIATRFILFLVSTLTILWLFTWLLKKIVHSLLAGWQRLLNNFSNFLSRHTSGQTFLNFIADKHAPHSTAQLNLSICFVLCISLFAVIAFYYVPYTEQLSWNQNIYHTFRGLRSPILDKLMFILTVLGDKKMLTLFAFLLCASLCIQKAWRLAAYWMLTWVTAMGSVVILKPLFQITRPLGLIHTRTGFAFPSGHALVPAALYGFLILLISYQFQNGIAKRYANYSFLLILFFTLLSRLYLGVHWLTDILGSVCLGYSIALITTLAYRCRQTYDFSMKQVGAWFATLCLLLPFSIYIFQYHIKYYKPIWPTHTDSAMHWWEVSGENIPIYRTSRTGKPIELINLQWLAPLSIIERELTEKGWTKPNDSNMAKLLNTLKKEKGIALPLLPQLYDDRPPSLVMIKTLKNSELLIVLRLWPSSLTLKGTTYPLWYGTVGYHILSKQLYLLRRNKTVLNPNSLPAPIRELIPDIEDFTWKKVYYTVPKNIQLKQYHKYKGLLIKSGLLTPDE